MILYKINSDNSSHRPGLFIESNEHWWLSESNSCDTDYILNEVLPNLEKIMQGELVQDPTRLDERARAQKRNVLVSEQ